MPSPSRALALDKAYLAVVKEQSFAKGRDALLVPAVNNPSKYWTAQTPESRSRDAVPRH